MKYLTKICQELFSLRVDFIVLILPNYSARNYKCGLHKDQSYKSKIQLKESGFRVYFHDTDIMTILSAILCALT